MVIGTQVFEDDYLDGFQYINNKLSFFPTAEGYVRNTIVNSENHFNYVFNYTDHLGNIRMSYGIDPATDVLKIMEENHYYPFGLKHAKYNTTIKDFGKQSNSNNIALRQVDPGGNPLDEAQFGKFNYKFQGQERQDELGLNWDSFKWRNYDYAIGRFMSIDPLAEKYVHNGVYNFSENRVTDARELEGLEAIRLTGAGGYSVLMTRPSTSYEQKSASAGFAIVHPIAARAIGETERGGTNISSVSGRIARHMTDGGNMSGGIGSESNGFRHALWSATMSNQFGSEIATEAANAHEGGKVFGSVSVDFSAPLVQNADYADSVVDILNNGIGRGIAEGLGENTSPTSIVREVLNVQKNEGLWQVSTDKDGNISVSRQKISQKQYEAGLKTINKLDNNGFSKKDKKDLESK